MIKTLILLVATVAVAYASSIAVVTPVSYSYGTAIRDGSIRDSRVLGYGLSLGSGYANGLGGVYNGLGYGGLVSGGYSLGPLGSGLLGYSGGLGTVYNGLGVRGYPLGAYNGLGVRGYPLGAYNGYGLGLLNRL